jgi:hypothetical protein
MRAHLALPLLALLAAPALAQSPWTIAAPTRVVPLGTFAEPTLTEASAAVASRRQPGVIWTLNDSGNAPWVFAVDSAGHNLGIFRVTGAENFDWETLTIAPCPAGSCLVIGDTGDNPEHRPSVTLYRIPEPTVNPATAEVLTATKAADTLGLRYPDGPHDIEALYADSIGNLFLISKGRSKGILLFRLPATAWTAAPSVVAERIDSLPISPIQPMGQWVTDAALAPDGRRVAVRTYSAVFFFTVGEGGRLSPDQGRECFFGQLEPQGEGVTWLDDHRLLLTSESSSTSAGTLYLIECGRP